VFYMINICVIKLYNYIVIHNSKFIRTISCISSYMFRLIYRAILCNSQSTNNCTNHSLEWFVCTG